MAVTDFDPTTATEADDFDPETAAPHPDNARDLFKTYAGREPANQKEIDDFVKEMQPKNAAREAASAMTGVPRLAAETVSGMAGGAVSLGAHAVLGTAGLVAGAMNPDKLGDAEDFANRKAREWSSSVSNLGNYVPATAEGAQFAQGVLAAPGAIVGALADSHLKPHMSEPAYRALGDVTQDVVTDASGLPFLGAAGKGLRAGLDAADRVRAPKSAPAAPDLTPPVGAPLSGADLRAQPNPIPAPEGTVHAAVHPAAITPEPAAPAPAPEPPTAAAAPSAAEPTQAPAPSAVALPATDEAPLDMSLTPDQRAIVREGVARRRAAEEAAAQQPPTAGPIQSPGDSQRGSARIFNEPAKEGPQETPQPEKQNERAGHLDALDQLSGGGLPTRRTSAINGDYNATGDDWQMKEVGSEPMRQQIASENAALHKATENVHDSVGSEFANSVDSNTLDDRGRVIRNAVQGIQDWFGKATDNLYDAARKTNAGRPIPKLQRVSDYLNDDSNFTNDAEIGLQKAAKLRMERLWSTGDPDKGAPPGSVNAAERLREFLNEKGKNPSAMGVATDLKNHLDMDVAEHGGPGLFQTARAARRHQYQMLEEPTGIKKLLTPSDSQGINHAIPTHKVADYIADLPTDQHEHVLNVLKAGAHLGGGELAESSAAAIREIQAHVISRVHNAATNADGTWNARKFYNAADRYARNAPALFKDRPDVLRNLKTINDAGNTLHMDKHYPGAAAQTERTGAVGHALETGGHLLASGAHEIPLVGRFIGRKIEAAAERAGGKIAETTRDREVRSRLVDRNGKQRGSVQVMREQKGTADEMLKEFHGAHTEPASVGFSGKRIGKANVDLSRDPFDPNKAHINMLRADEPNKGHGAAALRRVIDLADKHGTSLQLDAVPVGKLGPTETKLVDWYKQHGFELNPAAPGATSRTMVREPKTNGAMLNIGLHQGEEGSPNFRKMSKQEATGAVESTGAKVTKASVLTPDAHGVAEPTLVASTNRPLSEPEMQRVLAKTKQSAIPQRTAAGEESMHIAPGHEEIAKREGWDKFNPEYFRDHDGKVSVPSKQRGSVQIFNDNPLNRAAEERSRRGGVPMRNERSEYNANRQIAGQPAMTPERAEILRRLSGQRGSVRVMNEKPLAGAPEGDRPNGKARASAAAYAKKAGIDYQPLNEYRYVDPDVAKRVGDAYEAMKHDPTDPKVKKSYDAFKAETLAQYKQMVKDGVKVDLDPSYPYKNPREMHEDVRQNNHMSVYPTEAGFGSSDASASDHPLMEKAPVKMGGKDATYNDLFRAVHDYYGHAAEGNGFRANGEYNAWRAHRQMYSDAARGAMDAETLGQNSWVNSGPPAAFNKGASQADTIYADQKAGLLPKDVVKAAVEGVGADEHHVTNQLTDSERRQLRSDTTKRLIDAFHSTPATEEYAAAALAGAAKRGWYRQSAQAIVNNFGHEAPRFAALLSAMSPQVSVQTNFANALKTYVNWDKAGRPEDSSTIRKIMEESSQKSKTADPGKTNVLDAWVNNGVRALTADDPSNVKLSGPKVHSFYNNLTDNVNEVTNDAWMAAFAKIDPAKLGGGLNKAGPGKSPTYLALSGKVRAAASMLSRLTGERWTPAEVQETVWSWAKTAYEHAEEKGDRSIPELVKNGDITDELIRSTPDFHQLFSTEQHRGLLESSRFADNAKRVASGESKGADTAGASKAREAAQAALRPALLSAAERLEQLRQERKAAGKSAPKTDEDD